MAQLRLYAPFDLTPDTGGTGDPIEAGRVVYAASDLMVIRGGPNYSYYYGTYTYPVTGGWNGTISAFEFYHHGSLQISATGISLGTRYFTVPATLDDAMRAAFSGDDFMVGSSGADAIIGYAGADRMRGAQGDDRLFGRDGVDDLQGGAGRDLLNGGKGGDTLAGNDGNDRLVGDAGSDVFSFDDRDGHDIIADFQNGRDRIAIEGLRRFEALEMTRDGDGVHVTYGETEIVLQDTLLRAIDATDFGL